MAPDTTAREGQPTRAGTLPLVGIHPDPTLARALGVMVDAHTECVLPRVALSNANCRLLDGQPTEAEGWCSVCGTDVAAWSDEFATHLCDLHLAGWQAEADAAERDAAWDAAVVAASLEAAQ